MCLNVAALNLSRNYCVDFQNLDTMDCDSEKNISVKEEENLPGVTGIKCEQVSLKFLSLHYFSLFLIFSPSYSCISCMHFGDIWQMI